MAALDNGRFTVAEGAVGRAIRSAYLNTESGDLTSLENPDAIEQIRVQVAGEKLK